MQANEPVTVIEDAEVKLQVREVVQRSVKWAVKLSNKVLYVKVLGEHRSVRAYRNVPDSAFASWLRPLPCRLLTS